MSNVVSELFKRVDTTGKLRKVSNLSGIALRNLEWWKNKRHQPRIDLFEAAANAAGYELVLIPFGGNINAPHNSTRPHDI